MDQDMVRDVQCCDDDHGDGDEGDNDDDGDGDDDEDDDGINLFVGFTTFKTLLLRSALKLLKVPESKTPMLQNVLRLTSMGSLLADGEVPPAFLPGHWGVPIALQLLLESVSGAGEEAPPP